MNPSISLLRRKIKEGSSCVIRVRQYKDSVRFEPRITISSANLNELQILRREFGGSLSSGERVYSLTFYSTIIKSLSKWIYDINEDIPIIIEASEKNSIKNHSEILLLRKTLMENHGPSSHRLYS